MNNGYENDDTTASVKCAVCGHELTNGMHGPTEYPHVIFCHVCPGGICCENDDAKELYTVLREGIENKTYLKTLELPRSKEPRQAQEVPMDLWTELL